MKKIKGILLFITLIVLLVGVVSADDVSEDTLDTNNLETVNTCSVNDVDVIKDADVKTEDMKVNTDSKKEVVKNKINNVKTDSSVYNVSNCNQLNDAIYNQENNVTINVESNIIMDKSKGYFIDDTNKSLTINGNGHIIDGQGKYQFLWIGSKWNITINSLTFTNCSSGVHGGVIDNFGANITLNNCTLANSTAEYGGALDNQFNCTLILNNCNLINNNASGTGKNDGGGAIYNEENSTLIMNNCTLNDNIVRGSGGAIYNKGNATIINVTFNNNTAIVFQGGAIYSLNGNLTIVNSSLCYNYVSIDSGGAIRTSNSNLTLINTVMNYNKALNNGGALFAETGEVFLNNCTLNYNEVIQYAPGPRVGGAIYIFYSTFTINNSTLSNNKANQTGGAIYSGYSSLTINNSILSNNEAYRSGGAIYNYDGKLKITDSTFNNNHANGTSSNMGGGALYTNGTSTITDCTFNNNSASKGGAIFSSGGILNLYSSILRNNIATEKSMGGAIYNLDEAAIYYNTFITNQASDTGDAIKHSGSGFTSIHNTNNGPSAYGATINTKGDDVDIRYNEFYNFLNTNLRISTNNSNPRINDKINVTCILEDQFNFTLPDRFIRISVDNKSYLLKPTDDDGIVSFEYNLTNKTVKFTAKYEGEDNRYYPSTATLDISIPIDTQVLADDVSGVVGQAFRINGTLLDITGSPVKQETVYITLDDYTIITTTNDTGQFETKTALLKSGKYEMLTAFNGSDDYYPSNQTQTVSVLSQASIDIGILNHTEANVEMEIMVTDEIGTSIPEQDVIITLPNGTTTTQKTNSSGKIRITDTTATLGEKTVTATIESTEELIGTTESKNIMVVPDYQKIIENLINITKEQNNTINTLNNTVNELNGTVKKQEKIITEQNNTITVLNSTVNELNGTVKKQEKIITEQNNTINDLNSTVNELNGTVKKQEKIIVEQNNTINDLNSTVNELNGTVLKQEKIISEQNNTINDLNNQNKILNNTVNKLTQQLKDANNKITELNNIVNDLNNKLDTANKEIKTLKNTNNQLNKQVTTLNNTVKNLTAQLTKANKKITTLTNKNKNLTQQLTEANKKIKTLNNTNKKLTQQLKDANKKIAALEAEIKKLLNPTKLNTTITINPIKSSVGSVVKVSANVTDQKGIKVNGGQVIFKINGKTLKDEYNNTVYAIVSNGVASINYKVQDVWLKNTTTVQALYGGDDKHASSRVNSSKALKIKEGLAKITLDKPTITAKTLQTVTLRAKVIDANNDRINSSKVVFKLNGKTLTDKNGNALSVKVVDGEAVLDYTLPTAYTAKTYNVSAVFSDGYHKRAESSGKLILKKRGVTINTDSVTTKNGKTCIKATITDETGALLVKSTKLAIKINGKTVLNNVTSKNGKIDVSFITSLQPGMYELLIISGENGLYKSGKMTTVLNI